MSRLKALIVVIFGAGVAGIGLHLFFPFCWSNFNYQSEGDAIRDAAIFAAKHPRINKPFENDDALNQFLAENPDCCRVLSRDDPFYENGTLGLSFHGYTRVVEVNLKSEELQADYRLFVWVTKCGKIVEFSGTQG